MKPQVTNYDTETQTMTIKLDTGGEVKLNMEDEYFAYYGPGCDIELDFIEDAAKDIIFSVGGHRITVLQIIQWAQSKHDGIRNEALQNEADECDYIREVSSPFLSGRI